MSLERPSSANGALDCPKADSQSDASHCQFGYVGSAQLGKVACVARLIYG